MNWENFYFICFLIGFILSVVSFVSGSLHLHFPGHGHVHGPVGRSGTPGHTSGSSLAKGKAGSLPWFNFFTFLAFLTWFGAAGYLLIRHGLIAAAALALAIGSGIAGGGAVLWFFVKVLLPHDRPLDPADFEMVGVIARVSVPIREQGVGEIIFSQAGSRHSAGAKSETGTAIPRQTEVVVTRYEKGIAYVREWEEFAGERTQ